MRHVFNVLTLRRLATRGLEGRTTFFQPYGIPPVPDAGGGPPEPDLGETDPDGFGTFAAFGDVDQHALPFIEGGDPGSLEH